MKFSEIYFHTVAIAVSAGFLSGLAGVAHAETIDGNVQDHYRTVTNKTPYQQLEENDALLIGLSEQQLNDAGGRDRDRRPGDERLLRVTNGRRSAAQERPLSTHKRTSATGTSRSVKCQKRTLSRSPESPDPA